MGDIFRIMKEKYVGIDEINVTPENLAAMIEQIDKGVISNTAAKQVMEEMTKTGDAPTDIIERLGLKQVNDENAILDIIHTVFEANPQSIADYKGGKDRAVGFLVGQVMRLSKGKANPAAVNKLIAEELKKL